MAELMYDQFKLIEKKQLNSDDINSLTKLYLPLMGIDSYSLYIALSTLDVNVEYNFKTLIDMLNFKGVNSINRASSKLEALALLDVYVNSNKDYVFIINRPMSFREFFKEESLKALLISQIGIDAVLKLISEVRYDLKSYKKVSKCFDDVYDVSFDNKFDVIDKLVKSDFEIKNENFNYSLFKMLFDTSFISEDVLDQSEFKSNVLRISFIYKLNEEQMKDVVIRSLDIDKNIDYQTISKNAKYKFNEINKEKEARIITKENDDYLSSIKDDKTLALINYLESVSPSEVLQEISGIKASSAEIKMFEDLINNTKFPISVINFMILYVNKEKDGVLPGYAYFEKIANTWARAKVKNVYDAFKLLEKNNSEKQELKPKNKSKAKLPEWYQTYTEELDKKLDNMKKEQKDNLKADVLDEALKMFGE